MELGYKRYAEASSEFTWDEAWTLVDGSEDAVNATDECLDRHHGDAVAIATADGTDRTYTFEELSEGAAQFATLLEERGVERGDSVAIMLDISWEFLVSFFGTMKRGAVAVPCSELFGHEALEYRLSDAEPELVVTSSGVVDGVDPSLVEEYVDAAELSSVLRGRPTSYRSETSGGDVAWLQYTSGTTGTPTAVPYHHRSVALFAPVMDFVLDFDPSERCFTTSSVGWGTGIWIGLFAPLVLGRRTGFYAGRFDPAAVLEAVTAFDTTALIGVVPTAYRKLVEAADELGGVPDVEKAHYVGEPMEADLSRAVEATFGAFPRSTYGATELRSIVALDYAFPDYEFRHGSMGKPLFGVDVKIVDDDGEALPTGEVGRIAVRRGGAWTVSSDAGRIDEDGYLWSAGRTDDTIISAGYTIAPQEVETSLRGHPDVEDVGVIGVPDDERGHVVKAFVVPATDRSESLRTELQTYVKNELSKHEYPRRVQFVEEIPKTPNGKIRRERLREREGIP